MEAETYDRHVPIMDVQKCDWGTRDETKYRFPIGSDDKHAKLLAVRHRQWDVRGDLRRREPSQDGTGDGGVREDGTPLCFEIQAVKVQMGSSVVWCMKLFRFKRRGTRPESPWLRLDSDRRSDSDRGYRWRRPSSVRDQADHPDGRRYRQPLGT
jgi:hypothetical protein